MAHARLSREVDVGPGADDPAADVELAFEDNHGVRRRMTVGAASDALRISDQVVLLARGRVLEQQADPDRLVVHGGSRGLLGGSEVQRGQAIDDDRLVQVCRHGLG